jgi:hypothetical protein
MGDSVQAGLRHPEDGFWVPVLTSSSNVWKVSDSCCHDASLASELAALRTGGIGESWALRMRHRAIHIIEN